MRALSWPVSVVGNMFSALRYEVARLRGVRSMRGVVLTALVASALLTLPAARQMAWLVPPQTPRWVIGGGVAGVVLPGFVAALGAAWFGASSIGYEYRYGSGLVTFALVPRRGSVLLAKVGVAAGFGALLCPASTAVAYGTARLGFQVAGTRVALPVALLAPGPREVAMAALGGVLGVFAGAVLRVRVFGAATAVAGCALVAAFLPRSSSPAVPYLGEAARFVVRVVPALTYGTVSELLLALPLAALALAGLVAVRRRRVA
jgi:hypothetical protein